MSLDLTTQPWRQWTDTSGADDGVEAPLPCADAALHALLCEHVQLTLNQTIQHPTLSARVREIASRELLEGDPSVFTVARERAIAIGVWSAISGLAVAIGPVAGGALLRDFSWSSVFYVSVPVVVLAVVAGRFLLPESRDPDAGRFDPLGAVLSAAGIALLTWSIIEAPQHGWGSAATVGGILGALVLLTVFVFGLPEIGLVGSLLWTAVAALPVIALDSCEENDIEAPVDPLAPVELVLLVVVLAVDGSNAVVRLESSELIMATRAVMSEMLIVSCDHRRLGVRT